MRRMPGIHGFIVMDEKPGLKPGQTSGSDAVLWLCPAMMKGGFELCEEKVGPPDAIKTGGPVPLH